MRAQTEQAKRYWKKKEEEYGEKIHSRFMCKYSGTSPGDQKIEWGILFFSDLHLYFQGFASQKSWQSFLLRKTGTAEDKGSFIRLPLKELEFDLSVDKISWWEKILSKPERSLYLNHFQTKYKKVRYHFILFRPDAEKVAEIFRKTDSYSFSRGNILADKPSPSTSKDL